MGFGDFILNSLSGERDQWKKVSGKQSDYNKINAQYKGICYKIDEVKTYIKNAQEELEEIKEQALKYSEYTKRRKEVYSKIMEDGRYYHDLLSDAITNVRENKLSEKNFKSKEDFEAYKVSAVEEWRKFQLYLQAIRQRDSLFEEYNKKLFHIEKEIKPLLWKFQTEKHEIQSDYDAAARALSTAQAERRIYKKHRFGN